ncbi:hypothetical protein C8J57DRAFT_1506908 [Mycena rebaudengoi]|nr:hypothetical protein C8J57DRAFT_1506908 [Mycena rebaudengoi]
MVPAPATSSELCLSSPVSSSSSGASARAARRTARRKDNDDVDVEATATLELSRRTSKPKSKISYSVYNHNRNNGSNEPGQPGEKRENLNKVNGQNESTDVHGYLLNVNRGPPIASRKLPVTRIIMLRFLDGPMAQGDPRLNPTTSGRSGQLYSPAYGNPANIPEDTPPKPWLFGVNPT